MEKSVVSELTINLIALLASRYLRNAVQVFTDIKSAVPQESPPSCDSAFERIC